MNTIAERLAKDYPIQVGTGVVLVPLRTRWSVVIRSL